VDLRFHIIHVPGSISPLCSRRRRLPAVLCLRTFSGRCIDGYPFQWAGRRGLTREDTFHVIALSRVAERQIRRSVDRYLIGGGFETNHNLLLCLIHIDVISVGLQFGGEHLEAQLAEWDVVDGRLAIGIGL
jgi:hypothetical protein